MEGIIFIENFIKDTDNLFSFLVETVNWNEQMITRKTASFGKAYNYSQINYPFQEFLPQLNKINEELIPIIDFKSNNCLINYYLDGKSKMGYHSDQIDILENNTGIAIVSIGEMRTIKFRNIINPEVYLTYLLTTGSLLYMTQEIQKEWKHSIPKSDTKNGRISLTFRKIK